MNVLDLFSGIGGFSLGLERAGMRTVAFCEIEPYARAVLKKHWPQVPCYDDVRTLTADRLRADGIAADVICGGFPCQDISTAWDGPGLTGERSGLWSEYLRLVREVGPRFIIVENVAALLNRGLDQILGNLAEIGYDAEWHCVPASAVGAPHIRDRIWIIAYPDCEQHEGDCSANWRPTAEGLYADLAHADRFRCDEMEQSKSGRSFGEGAISKALYAGFTRRRQGWEPEPNVGRVADGVPRRVDRLRGLGNAVVPQIPEIIGRAIMKVSTVSPANPTEDVGCPRIP